MLSKSNMKATLKFARENADKDQDLWNNVLWTDQSKTELCGHRAEDMFGVGCPNFFHMTICPNYTEGQTALLTSSDTV